MKPAPKKIGPSCYSLLGWVISKRPGPYWIMSKGTVTGGSARTLKLAVARVRELEAAPPPAPKPARREIPCTRGT